MILIMSILKTKYSISSKKVDSNNAKLRVHSHPERHELFVNGEICPRVVVRLQVLLMHLMDAAKMSELVGL